MKTDQTTTTQETTTPSAVPSIDSPTGNDIPTVTHATPEAKTMKQGAIDAADAIGLTPKRLSPKDALGKFSEGEGVGDRLAKNLRERGDNGQFKPVAPAGGKPKAKEPRVPRVKPDAVPPEEPEPQAKVTAPVVPEKPEAEKPKLALTEQPKVKIGDKEMTPEEVARYVAELEAKAKPPEQKQEAAKPEDQPPQDDSAAREREFLDATVKDFNPADYGIDLTPESLDTILSGGQEGVEYFLKTVARIAAVSELRARQWAAEQFNPILKGINDSIHPVVETHQQVTQYERERQFFETHKDLTPHRQAVRNVAKALRDKYPAETATMSAEEFNTEVAKHVRQMASEFGVTPQAEAPAAPEAQPKPALPRPTPPAGHAPSGAGAARQTSQQASIIANVAKFR